MKNETNHLPIVLARKPLSEKSIAENVLRWGTGGINIDGCRIGTDDILGRQVSENDLGAGQYGLNDGRKTKPTNKLVGTFNDNTKGLGRFPANIIFDEEAGKILDEQSGISKSSKSVIKGGFDSKVNTYVGGGGIIESERGHNDTGGASRFFYQIKNEDKINKQINEKGKRMKNENVKLMLGDNIEKLRELPDNFVDSIITDPPYGLSFMNKKWDYDVPSVNFWKEVLRVLKPGGHVLSFGGTRTYHRMVVNMEDAGFEIRDQIMWVYGSGFPKSHNIGKAIDKLQGVEIEKGDYFNFVGGRNVSNGGNKFRSDHPDYVKYEAQNEYEGWGTALKPANEPICMARKPLSEKTIAENVLEHGTGGINVDGCRIGTTDNLSGGVYSNGDLISNPNNITSERKKLNKEDFIQPEGRFPANIIFDEEAGKILDEQSGDSKSVKRKKVSNTITKQANIDFGGGIKNIDNTYGDTGGASRFFYVPKVSKKERNMGLDDFEEKEMNTLNNGIGKRPQENRLDKPKNNHPTVKPINLLTYLVRLITPPNGIVMDCYMGSGSVGIAAQLEGFQFIGMEMDEDYFNIAEARINNWEQYKDLIKTK